MEIVALFGLPASGKGTLAQQLEDALGFPQLSTGDMLRRMAKEDGPIGESLRALPPASFASDALVLDALEAELEGPKYANGAIFDGFPRTLAQWEAMVSRGLAPALAIELVANEEVLASRASARRVHLPSGRIYNLESRPPRQEGLDDLTGEPLTWRADDQEGLIRGRFADYWSKTAPILTEAKKLLGGRFIRLDAMEEPEAIFKKAMDAAYSVGLAVHGPHSIRMKP